MITTDTITFLKFTPQLAALFGYLWEKHKNPTGFCFKDFPGFDSMHKKMASECEYIFGDTVDGIDGYLLIIAMNILLKKLKAGDPYELQKYCCTSIDDIENPSGPPVLVASEVMETLSFEIFSKAFKDLDEGQKQEVDLKFFTDYIDFETLVEETCEKVGVATF